MSRYYQAALPKSLQRQIKKLFDEYPDVGEKFDGNKIKFIEDAIRRHIIYFEEMKKAGAKYDSD